MLGRLVASLEYGEVERHLRRGRAADAAGLLDGHQRRRRGRDEGVLLEPRAARSARSRCRRHSNSNVADRRARHPLLVRRLDQRGVQRASSQARAPRRPTLLLVRPRHRAARCLDREYRDRFGNVRAPLRRARVSISDLSVTARSEVWTPERIRRRRGGAVAARPLGSAAGDRYVPLDGSVAELAAIGRLGRAHGHETAHALMTAVRGDDEVRARHDDTCTRWPTKPFRPGTASARTSPTC